MPKCNYCDFLYEKLVATREMNGISYKYCEYCFETARDYYIKDWGKWVPDKNHKDLEKQVKELTEANEKLKAELESERESFEIALDNAEKWHKEKLEFRDEEIAEKNDRIKHLERLLFNVSMSSKLTELENKVKNLENKIEIPPK